MSQPGTPRTYDEITRRTVPDPDSSFRAAAGAEALPDRGLRARVADALVSVGYVAIGFELDGHRVVLRGCVRDAATRSKIEQLVVSIDGVESVDNRIHWA